jgi:hypothetical protein
MNQIEFLYIGWCKQLKKGVQSDKVWTAFKVGDKYYAGWGARGKSIRFKKHLSEHELMRVQRSKEREYNEVDSFQLFTIFPYFENDVEKYLAYNILTNKVM